MSNEKNPGWLGYIGDELLPRYIGIILNHYKDPNYPTRIQWKVIRFFFVAQVCPKNSGFPPRILCWGWDVSTINPTFRGLDS